MSWKTGIARFSVARPRLVVGLAVLLVVLCAAAGVMRAIGKHWDIVDTDPENMLSPREPVRVFHNETKQEFSLHDMLVLGIVNESDPDGVFNPRTLSRIQTLTEYIKGIPGVIAGDLIAPSEVDTVEQAGPGTLKFERLMEKPPETREEARLIGVRGKNQPILYGTLLSEDAKALCLYVPIREKKLSHAISGLIRSEAVRLGMREMDFGSKDHTGDRFGITGLPVAEDTFGVEMFVQMAVSAPLAMVIIILILLYFFRKFSLVLSPVIVGVSSAISCMGLLIGFGNTVHIMSSMIPIFVLPISVEDSVHILSQFYERYQKYRDPGKTIVAVMEELFTPMLYTTLTTIAGFASLALTPIPPVQTFGIFVAVGVAFAWLFTVAFIPAYVTFIPRRKLETFGAATQAGEEHAHQAFLSRRLDALGTFTYSRAKLIVGMTAAAILFSVYGVSRLRVNDNPTKWFGPRHPIRVADRVLNSHFGGTYLAYLVLQPVSETGVSPAQIENRFKRALAGDAEIPMERRGELLAQFSKAAREYSAPGRSTPAFIDKMVEWAEDRESTAAPTDAPLWDTVLNFLSEERARADVFKRPEVLRYVERLDELMVGSRVVGKTNSAATMVKHINRELRSGEASDYAVPKNARMVAECYMQAQSGHDPGDLWHLVTPDYGKANIWVQLKSGDNKDMETIVRTVDRFIKDNPPPLPLKHQWAGLTYVNVEWQNKMVSGMLRSLLGSFAMVFLMMAFLFRSMLWGLLCMVPLTVTIALIYALIGIAGKDYDMPVAVLSSLTLGLAVDFSIHYLSRVRELFREMGEWGRVVRGVAGETARAIARNVAVITLGFLPLLAAPLVPYQTVGFFMAAIMCVSGIGTLVILPALITVLRGVVFRKRPAGALCRCSVCLLTALAAVPAIAYLLNRYRLIHWTLTTVIAAIIIIVAMVACSRISRREAGEETGR